MVEERETKMRIEGISHLTFVCQDVEKTAQMFEIIFSAKEVYDSKGRNFSLSREKFLVIDELWIALMEGEALPKKTYNHVAFKISQDELPLYMEKIKLLNLEIKNDRSRILEEADSLYFYDYDNHLFELHTGTLKERLEGYHRKDIC